MHASTVDRKNTNVICHETPHSKCVTKGADARISTFRVLHEHAIGGEHILLLTRGFGLKVGDAAGKEIRINGFTLGLAEL